MTGIVAPTPGDSGPPEDGRVELFPVGIGHYDHHEPLDVAAEIDRVADLLSPFGGAPVPWPVSPERRDRVAIDQRLRQWSSPSEQKEGEDAPIEGTILYWVGHGSGGGSEVVLLDARSPDEPAGEGVTPGNLARVIRNRHSHVDHGDGWIIVIVDACLSARFVELLNSDLTRNRPPQRVLLIGTSTEGITRLGRFSRALRALLNDAYGGQAEISLWKLAEELDKRYLLGCFVAALRPADAALRRRAPLPAGLSGPHDMVEELRSVLAELDETEREHFLNKGKGAENSELTWYFTGRRAELRAIANWLRERSGGLLVVTGDPGAGKSALLGYALAQSRPRLRHVLDAHGLLTAADEADRPPDGAFTAGLLLSGMNMEEVVDAFARVCGLDAPPKTSNPLWLAQWLVGRITQAARKPITLLLDGLDEARQPMLVADRVLRRLAEVPGVRVVVGTRRAVHEEIGRIADRHSILDALGIPAGEPSGPDVVEVPRDPEALRVYVEGRLQAAADRGAFGAHSYDRAALLDAAMQVARNGREFLFARLAVHELLAHPELLADPGKQDWLLTGDHRRLFAGVVERLCAADEVNARLLRALAYARGQGLPISGGVWAAIAQALPEGTDPSPPAPTPEEFETFKRLAAPYIVMDVADGETVYRLAHRTFQEHFVPGEDGHRRIVVALLDLIEPDRDGPLHPYLSRHVSAHAAAAGMSGWRELARRTDVLDVLDARALGADAVRSAFGHTDVPDAIAGILGSRDMLARARPADRRGVREISMARHAGTSRFPARAGKGTWSVHAAWLHPQQAHVVLERRAGGPLNAIATFTQANGRRLLAAAGEDWKVRIWDPTTGKHVRQMDGHRKIVRALTVLPTAKGRVLLATAGDDRTIRIWDPVRGRRPLRTIRPSQGNVRALAAVPLDERVLLASGGDDGTVRFWDPVIGKQVGAQLTGHDHWILGMTCFRGEDGRTLLATTSRDKTVRIWDPTADAPPRILTGHNDWVLAVTAFPGRGGRTLLATASADRTVRIWDPLDGRQVREPFTEHNSWVRDLAVLTGPNGDTLLASVSDDKLLWIWNPLTGEQIRHQPWSGHTKEIKAVCAFSGPGGRPLLATAAADFSVRIWDPGAGPVIWDRSTRHTGPVYAVSLYHHQGQPQLATASSDRTIGLWDPDRAEALTRLAGQRGSVHAVTSFKTPGSHTSLLATGGNDRLIHVWNLEDGLWRQRGTLAGHKTSVRALTVFNGPDKKKLLASADATPTVRIWDPLACTTFGDPITTGHNKVITTMTAMPGQTGRPVLVTGSKDGTVRILDPLERTETTDPIRRFTQVLSLLSFTSSERHLLAIGGRDRAIRIIDPMTGIQQGTDLAGHNAGVSALASLNIDDRVLILSGSWDRTLRIWDPTDGQLLRVIPIGMPINDICLASRRAVVVGPEGLLIINLPRLKLAARVWSGVRWLA